MKITTLLETNTTPSSDPAGLQSQQAPKFGRDPHVLEDDEKLDETTAGATGSGSVATVSQPLSGVQRRGKGSMLQGIKTSKKFPNSAAVKEGLTEGPGFDKWADERAAAQLHKLNIPKTWEVSYDYGPHMTKTVTVKAGSEEEARARVEKAAEKKGLSIMINSVEPVEQGVAEYGNTTKGQKMLSKVHHRAADRVTSKKADKDPSYARKAQQTQDRAWDRMKDVAEAEKYPEPEQEIIDATRRARLQREREPQGSDKIDARLAQRNAQLQQYTETGKFWLKKKDTQEHISDAYVGKAQANQAALQLLKKHPELKGNIVITAWGPGETPMNEAELSEEQLLARDLKKQLELFKQSVDHDLGTKPNDKDLGKKPKDKEVQKK